MFLSESKTKPSAHYKYKESNCFEYDLSIDDAIIDELPTLEPLNSVELKDRIDARLHRCISYNTFIAHIRRMLSHNELTKKDTGEKGKPALFYYSTEYSRKRRKLEILRPFSKQMDEAMKVYAKVFFFSIIGKNTCDIKDLDRFLADLGSYRDKLIPDIVRCLDRSKGVFVSPMVIIDQEIPPGFCVITHPTKN